MLYARGKQVFQRYRPVPYLFFQDNNYIITVLICSLNNRIFIITAVCFHFIVNSRTVSRYNLIALQTHGISILSLTSRKFLWYFVIFYAIIYDKQ